HEVVMQLLADAPELNDREHLCALAARMMRHYLINHANRRRAQRHGGDAVQVTLNNDQLGTPDVSIELVALGQALESLEAVDPRKAEVLDLFYFGGMTYEEIAEAIGVSRATVTRELRIGRAFVTARLEVESD
ncbi:MAG: RNA polymerase subunit sigma-70, partial [Gammaproteobacteria bacterium HGW-Gammaproteobacteria-8]